MGYGLQMELMNFPDQPRWIWQFLEFDELTLSMVFLGSLRNALYRWLNDSKMENIKLTVNH